MKYRMIYILVIAASLLAGCDFDFDKYRKVENLRVLAVSAEPPEISPGEGTSIEVLWADPKGNGRTVEFVWWFCAGYAYGTNLQMCKLLIPPVRVNSDDGGDRLDIPTTPADLLETIELPEGMDKLIVSAVGLLCAEGKLPSDKKLADPESVAHIDEYCQGGEAVSFLRTIELSKTDSPQENPGIDRVMSAGAPLVPQAEAPEGKTVRCKEKEGCGITVPLKLFMTEGSQQQYEDEKYGETIQETEVLFVTWFTTDGDFDDGSQSLVEKDAETPYGPFQIGWEPEKPGTHTVYAVAQDNRGGVSYESYVFEVLPAR